MVPIREHFVSPWIETTKGTRKMRPESVLLIIHRLFEARDFSQQCVSLCSCLCSSPGPALSNSFGNRPHDAHAYGLEKFSFELSCVPTLSFSNFVSDLGNYASACFSQPPCVVNTKGSYLTPTAAHLVRTLARLHDSSLYFTAATKGPSSVSR